MSLMIVSAVASALLAPQSGDQPGQWVAIGENERVHVAVQPASIDTNWRGRKTGWFTYALTRSEDFEGRIVDYVTYVSEFDCRRRTIRNITNVMYRLGAPASYPTFTYDRPAEPPPPGSLDDQQLRYVCDRDIPDGERFPSALDFVRRVRGHAPAAPIAP